uniref:Mutator-like transposase domain-containing protein n=1 Tax=Sipha flava TaxID=143950 RepID=A0A2S2QTQ8_9HEMI
MKKVIFLGVQNKYCSICAKAQLISKEPNTHKCFKNWLGTSTCLEPDIILEGFKESVSMHNLIYSRLIGDGDSSVIKILNMAKSYGPTLLVKKIECKNHILRNYINRLKEITSKRKSTKDHWKNLPNLTQYPKLGF